MMKMVWLKTTGATQLRFQQEDNLNVTGGEKMFALDKENFQSEVLESTEKVLVFFSGDG
ncbi:MAG: hypothetical protein FWB98_04115 [Defluviitaleaceae bacterium]|nr:hypothetical protein [Defluviitaleaceae bacterium]